MLVYKYSKISGKVLRSLKKGNLFFRNPLEFDDSMDSRLRVKNNLEEVIQTSITDLRNHPDKLQFMKEKMGYVEGSIVYSDENIDENDNDVEKLIKQYINQYVGVTCFTERDDNLEMWKEYGDCGMGFCMGFETEEDSNFFKDLTKVDYMKEEDLPEIDFSVPFYEVVNQIKIHFSTKRIEGYSFEEEHRLLRHFNTRTVEYNKRCLKKIVLGSNIWEESEKYIRSLIERYYDIDVVVTKSEC